MYATRPPAQGALQRNLPFLHICPCRLTVAVTTGHNTHPSAATQLHAGHLDDEVKNIISLVHITAGFQLLVLTNDTGWHTDSHTLLRQILAHHRACADLGAVADVYGTHDGGSRPQEHAMPNGRMPHTCAAATAADSHAVQHRHIVPHDCSLANDHTGCVIDHDTPADVCGGVNVYIKDLADTALQGMRQTAPAVVPQVMGHSVCLDGLKALEEEEDLHWTKARGVAVKDRLEVCKSILDNHLQERAVVRASSIQQYLYVGQRREGAA